MIKVITDEDLGLTSVEMENPTIRYGARGIVKNKDGMIALLHKKNKNEYKLPGGGIEKDETPNEAFLREIFEETGCKVYDVEKLGTIEENKTLDNFKQISYVFTSKVAKDSKELHLTKKEQDEGAELVWANIDEAKKLIETSYNNLVASKYESVYSSKFIILRDLAIVNYYLENLKSINS